MVILLTAFLFFLSLPLRPSTITITTETETASAIMTVTASQHPSVEATSSSVWATALWQQHQHLMKQHHGSNTGSSSNNILLTKFLFFLSLPVRRNIIMIMITTEIAATTTPVTRSRHPSAEATSSAVQATSLWLQHQPLRKQHRGSNITSSSNIIAKATASQKQQHRGIIMPATSEHRSPSMFLFAFLEAVSAQALVPVPAQILLKLQVQLQIQIGPSRCKFKLASTISWGNIINKFKPQNRDCNSSAWGNSIAAATLAVQATALRQQQHHGIIVPATTDHCSPSTFLFYRLPQGQVSAQDIVPVPAQILLKLQVQLQIKIGPSRFQVQARVNHQLRQHHQQFKPRHRACNISIWGNIIAAAASTIQATSSQQQ
jgi:hypothetical protein